jgi:hypothetical protein
MNHRSLIRALASTGVACLAALAQAQEPPTLTVAELLADKAKLIERDELKTLVTGSRMTGFTFREGQTYPVDFQFKADGKFTGTVSPQSGNVGVSGNWNINDKGQFCYKGFYTNRPGMLDTCLFIFLRGTQHYTAGSTTEGDRIATLRTFKPL